MTTLRQDAWTEAEDQLLAETVLQFIREGKTQLQAFEEVGKKLSRTAAACGFRWNAFVRKQHEQAIELAKQERKKKKEPPARQTLTMDDVISFLQSLKAIERADEAREIERLNGIIHTLQKEKEELERQLQLVEQDYRALIDVLERARQRSV